MRKVVGQRHVLVKPRPSLEGENERMSANQQIKYPPLYGVDLESNSGKLTWGETLKYLLDSYGQKTTVHGLRRICQRRTGRKERVIWTLGFFVALYLLAIIYALVSERFLRKQFKTVVNETFYPIFKLPFPEVIICNANRLNWGRLDSAMENFLKPNHRTVEFELLFMDIVSRYDKLMISTLLDFEGLFKEQLEVLNYVNFTNVVEHMAWRCDEILVNCRWRWKSVNCCDIFFPRRTLLGQCLAFNTILTPKGTRMIEENPNWPLHNGRGGRGSGLTLTVLINEKLHCPKSEHQKGVLYMVKEQVIYSDYVFTEVRANNIARVAITGIFTFHDNITRSVSSKDRDCVFENERSSKDFKTLDGTDYNFENCFYECQRQQMFAACNCTMDLFFPPNTVPVCQLRDMPCLVLNYDKFNSLEAMGDSKYLRNNKTVKSRHCNCLLSCHSLILDIVSRTEPQRTKTDDTNVELDFYWRDTYIMTYRTSLVFSWLDLLVSFGGIASLLLGCSLMSIVELLYFLLFDVPEFIHKKRISDKRLQELKRKQSIKALLDYDSSH